jgi:hypothetical protein
MDHRTDQTNPRAALHSSLPKPLRDFRKGIMRFLRNRQHRLIFHTLVLSVLVSFGAILFVYCLRLMNSLFMGELAGYQAPGLPNEGGALQEVIGAHGLWLVPVATTLGGLITGIIIFRLAPEAEGHGTDGAIRAFHRTAGVLRLRVAPVKAIASAITIGSGGSAGREGPVALIGATLGSAYGDATNQSEDERRLLLLVGLAAGIAAVFATVTPRSWLEGKQIRELGLHTEDVNILTIIRGEHMAAARPDSRLEANDRLLRITSPTGWEHFAPHVQTGRSERAGGSPTRGLTEATD